MYCKQFIGIWVPFQCPFLSFFYIYISVRKLPESDKSHFKEVLWCVVVMFNTFRPRQNGHRFADDNFKRIFLNENVRILIKISLKFVPEGPINNIPALVQIMAWRRSGDKPLSEPIMVSLRTHICVIRPQWVNKVNIVTTVFNLVFWCAMTLKTCCGYIL